MKLVNYWMSTPSMLAGVHITHGGLITDLTHIISTIAPINGFDIIAANNRPHVVEGDGTNDLTIHFETGTSRQA